MTRTVGRLGIVVAVMAGLLAVGAAPASATTIRRSTRTYRFSSDCGLFNRGLPVIGTVQFIANGPDTTIIYVLNTA